MRIRVLAAAATGALALTALGVPTAQADGGSGDTRITKVVVDGDNKVSIGTGSAKILSVSVTATDNSGILGADSFDLKGPGYGQSRAARASSRTCRPCSLSRPVSARAGSSSASSTSGAPSSHVLELPSASVKAAPLYLRAEEKGSDPVRCQSSGAG
ncbi:hypothetical protein STENM223S_07773 [Streptomyces tendae]